MNINALSIMETCKRVDDFRVWIALSCRMDKNNAVDFTNMELAAALGMSDSQVCSALNRLRANGIVITTKSNGRKTHKLAEGLQWKGKNKDFPSNYIPIGSSQKYDPDAKWNREAQTA
jgi:biotin operon repressor